MPQLQPLTASAVTPEGTFDVTMEPTGTKDGLSTYIASIIAAGGGGGPLLMAVGPTASVPALQPTLALSIVRPSKTSRLVKVRVKLNIPEAALDINGLPTAVKSHENSVDKFYIFDQKSSEAERNKLDAVFTAITENADVQEVIRKNKSMY